MNKGLRLFGKIVCICLLGFAFVVWNAFNGNIVSDIIATNVAESYIEEQYPNTDYIVENVDVVFLLNGYTAHIVSPSSIDTDFRISLGFWGCRVGYDSYNDTVLTKESTYGRITNEYHEKIDDTFFVEDGKLFCSNSNAWLINELNHKSKKLPDDFGIKFEDLIFDYDYDIEKMGSEYGFIYLQIQDEDVSVKRASEILLDIKKICDDNNLSFKVISLTLTEPSGLKYNDDRHRDVSFVENNLEYIRIDDMLYSEIYEDGLEERVKASVVD